MSRSIWIGLLLIFPIMVSGINFEEAHADVVENQFYLIEGTGFAITDEEIKTTEIDFLMATDVKVGNRANTLVEDGFVTLDSSDFIVTDVTGDLLRDGRFLRLGGTAENSLGNQVTLSLFGRLIEDSGQGSVYSFTGRINEGSFSNKIIYTSKISLLSESLSTSTITPPPSIITTPTPAEVMEDEKKELTILIVPGSSRQDFGLDYITSGEVRAEFSEIQGTDPTRVRYLIPNRATITPGTILTFENHDEISHNIVSAKRDTNSRGLGQRVIPDGLIDTGYILPGEKASITIDRVGFIFLIDIDYQWMRMDITSFPAESATELIKSSTDRRQKGN